ncbi:MAG: ATP-binding cassette domain-containing protein [Treponema sp.]|uniref:ATP-binding cassette domain-containing protein n=1 Tax=Treponema sp. TaxID=166 RepID=UPI00360D923C
MIFAVHNGTFAFKGGVPILRDISFSIESGQILSILGPNGVGKTTLLPLHDGDAAMEFRHHYG